MHDAFKSPPKFLSSLDAGLSPKNQNDPTVFSGENVDQRILQICDSKH